MIPRRDLTVEPCRCDDGFVAGVTCRQCNGIGWYLRRMWHPCDVCGTRKHVEGRCSECDKRKLNEHLRALGMETLP